MTSTNPYYLMQVTYQSGAQVLSGTKVAECTIASYTKCPRARLSAQNLQGAFLSYSAFPKADLSKANLKVGSIAFSDFSEVTGKDLDLAGTSLVRANLSGSALPGARMVLNDAAEADLSNAVLDGATLVDSSFVKTSLRGASLKGAVVRGDVFSGADVRGADFTGADLSESDFVGAKATGAKWKGATFCNTLMPDGSVRGRQDGSCPGAPAFGPADSTITLQPSEPFYLGARSQLTSVPAQPYGSTLAGCELVQRTKCPGVDFHGMNLTGALLGQSDLRKANLDNVQGDNASLVLSNLAGASAQRTSFVSGAVTGSDVRDARLPDTVWTFASAALADMRGSDLSGADFGFGDLIGADLSGATLAGVDLSDSNAIGVNLTNANMRGVNLADADLTGATLTGADLTDAQYCNTIMPDGSVKAPQEGLCPGQHEPTATPSP